MVGLDAQIKYLRKMRKMTQNELAIRLGISASTVSSYENGIRLPSYDILLRMARLFNVTVDSLLGHSSKDMIDISD